MVNVIGLGYIGLPTALMMASHGVEVVGTNHGRAKVDMLRSGRTTFKEKGLDELFQAALQGGIQFTTEPFDTRGVNYNYWFASKSINIMDSVEIFYPERDVRDTVKIYRIGKQ